MTEIKFILLTYFTMMIGIGIYSFFRIKNVSDYYISGKNSPWWQVSGSLFATIIGGSAILGTFEICRKAGWAGIWFLSSASAGLFVLAMIAGKVSRLGHFTLPEMIGLFYGRKAERTATMMIPVAWLGVIAVQIIAGAKTLSGLNLMSYREGALLCGLVFIFYTLIGGQKSVLLTDFIQALIILGGTSVLFAMNIIHIRENVHPSVTPGALFNENFNLTDLLVLLVTYSVTFVVGPDIYTRIFSARNEKTARNSVVLVAFIIIPFAFMLTFLGVTATGGSTAFSGNSLVLPGTSFLPPWAIGLMAIIMLSAIMSSAGTTLLSSSTILAELVTGNLDKKGSCNLTRVFIVVMGGASILTATKVTSIMTAMLLSLSFFSGAFILPVVAGIAGWKINRHSAYAAMIAGGVTALSGKIFNEIYPGRWGYLLIIAAYVINCILLFMPFRKLKKDYESDHWIQEIK
jgi:solute:Na+ symporter, SSS family